jgi:putative flippase GtrA
MTPMDVRNRWLETRRIRSEAARYIGIGLIAYALGLGLAALFRERLEFSAELSIALTLVTLLVANFWLSRRLVFRAEGNTVRQFVAFVATSLGMRMGEYVLFYMLLKLLHLHYLIAFTIALMMSNGLKFCLYRSLVFR